jgi:hypothetical protein
LIPWVRLDRAVRVALALWFVLAFAVWNVVFDRLVVVAGRQYVHSAVAADSGQRPPVLINDWMRPAIARAARLATVAGVAVLAGGVAAIGIVARRRRPEELPCAPSHTR